MLKSIQSNNSPGHTHNGQTSVIDLSTDFCPGNNLTKSNKMELKETSKPSRKKAKIFAVSVWSEVERVVYVKANTAKQAENLIDECQYVEGENEFAETIMDEGGNIGHTTRMVGENYDTIEVEEKKRIDCSNNKDRVITYYARKKNIDEIIKEDK